jgi:glycosyltransferase involved in cell wall biosynthesis
MNAGPLRLALVVPYYEPDANASPAALRASALGELAAALAARGHAVRAWQLARRAGTVAAGGATIELVPSSPLLRRAAELAFRRAPRYGPAYFEPAWRLNAALGQWRPTAVHSAGLTMDLNLGLAGRTAARAAAPLLVQFHGGLPAADRLTNLLRRANARRAARVLFTHPEQAAPWLDAGILEPDRVGQAFETSVRISPLPRAVARARTGIDGDPACLMLGRLEAVKDPITTLTGFALIAERRPLARLHVYALTEALRRECEALVAALPTLAGRVRFHPAWPRARMNELYSAADLLLQSSRREWSSLTVMEALACGCLPVLSAIPAFRALTDEGRVGALFPVGRPELLARAAVALGPGERRAQAPSAMRRFEEALSFEALAERIEAEARGALGGA